MRRSGATAASGRSRRRLWEVTDMMELLLTLLVGAVFSAGVFVLWVGRSFHPPIDRHHERTYQHRVRSPHPPSP